MDQNLFVNFEIQPKLKKMRKLVLVLSVGFLSLSSCKKVTACLEADISTAKLGQTITLTNCSENQEGTKLDAKDGEGSTEMDGTATAVYHSVGTFTPSIISTKKSKSETAEISITIEEPTEAELIGTWNMTEKTTDISGFTVTVPEFDVITFNIDGTSSNGDWSLSGNASITVGNNNNLTIYTLYNNELIVKEIEDEFIFYLYHFTKG